MTREPIRFQAVTRQQQFDELKTFATSDGHLVTDHSLLPIVTMHRGDRQFGYYHVLNHPIIMPAFHTDLCDPIDFKEACERVTAWQQINSMSDRFPGGTCFIALPPSPLVDERIIEKVGYENIHRNLWQATPRQ